MSCSKTCKPPCGTKFLWIGIISLVMGYLSWSSTPTLGFAGSWLATTIGYGIVIPYTLGKMRHSFSEEKITASDFTFYVWRNKKETKVDGDDSKYRQIIRDHFDNAPVADRRLNTTYRSVETPRQRYQTPNHWFRVRPKSGKITDDEFFKRFMYFYLTTVNDKETTSDDYMMVSQTATSLTGSWKAELVRDIAKDCSQSMKTDQWGNTLTKDNCYLGTFKIKRTDIRRGRGKIDVTVHSLLRSFPEINKNFQSKQEKEVEFGCLSQLSKTFLGRYIVYPVYYVVRTIWGWISIPWNFVRQPWRNTVTPWIPHDVSNEPIEGMSTWINGWGPPVDDDIGFKWCVDDKKEDKKKKPEDKKTDPKKKKDEDSEPIEKNNESGESQSLWDKWEALETWMKVLSIAGSVLLVILLFVWCYCCCCAESRQPGIPMYAQVDRPLMAPPQRSRRRSSVPARVWPPRRGSTRSRKSSRARRSSFSRK